MLVSNHLVVFDETISQVINPAKHLRTLPTTSKAVSTHHSYQYCDCNRLIYTKIDSKSYRFTNPGAVYEDYEIGIVPENSVGDIVAEPGTSESNGANFWSNWLHTDSNILYQTAFDLSFIFCVCLRTNQAFQSSRLHLAFVGL